MTKKTSKKITRELNSTELASVSAGIVGRDQFDNWWEKRLKIERFFTKGLQYLKK